jgi:hypothetical protein
LPTFDVNKAALVGIVSFFSYGGMWIFLSVLFLIAMLSSPKFLEHLVNTNTDPDGIMSVFYSSCSAIVPAAGLMFAAGGFLGLNRALSCPIFVLAYLVAFSTCRRLRRRLYR